MGGLEKITADILSEAEAEAKAIFCAAQKKASEICAAAEQERAELSKKARREAERECARLGERILKKADALARKEVLSAKNEIIEKSLSEIKQSIADMETGEYFGLMRGLIIKNAEEGEGVMLLSKRDSLRVPKDFLKTINENIKGKITLSDSAGDFSAGFIIRYGKIDINCTIDRLFEDKRERLADLADRLLFKDEG